MRQIGPASQAAGYTGPLTSLSTISSYLKDVEQPIGTDTVILEGLVTQLLALIPPRNGDATLRLWTDAREWKLRWETLRDTPQSGAHGPLSLMTAPMQLGLLTGWDGAGDAVLLSEDAEASWLGHPRLVRLANVVGELQQLGLPVEAHRIARILLDAAAELFPPQGEQMLAARHTAAYWTGEAGDAAAARAETETLLTDCLSALGAGHTLTHLARLRLAVWEERCDHTLQARRLFRTCADAPDAPDRLRLLARLGVARSLRDVDEAVSAGQVENLLHDLEDAYGVRHPVLLAARLDAAWARYEPAMDSADVRGVVETLKAEAVDALGSDHPVTLRIRTSHVLITAGESMLDADLVERLADDARQVRRDVQRVCGGGEPSVFNLRAVETTCVAQSDPEQARILQESLVEEARKQLGDRHRVALGVQYHLAWTTHRYIGADAARSLYEQWLSEATAVLGADSRSVLAGRHALAISVAVSEGMKAARPLYEELLADQTHQLGADHPQTLLTRVGYVVLVCEVESPTEALALAESLLADQIGVQGQEHWRVLLTRRIICHYRMLLEGTAAVLPAYSELLADYVQAFGVDHYDARRLRARRDKLQAGLKQASKYRRACANRPDWAGSGPAAPLVVRAALARAVLDTDGPAAALPLYAELLPELERVRLGGQETVDARQILEAHSPDTRPRH
ncbi:hypothetical protein [Streptomyces sp. GESEQ-35]|uniref:hypothetical protein n=1 Tax=Streptomyces sp. GESEQ-35 TaxID=2812657 RepID=UPI001B32F433|nr:hypothetical protein [Streptomyces sp. GESEQ-35]